MKREEFLKKLHPSITHINASDNMSDETLYLINNMVDKVCKMDKKQIALNIKTTNRVLSKKVALWEMAAGWKLTHYYFTPEEWVTIENDMMVFEDGCRISVHDFFSSKSEEFESGWTIWFPIEMPKTDA